MATAPSLTDYLDHHPIADVETEHLLARAAAEVLAGDGRRPTDEERAQYDPWTSRVETPLFDLADAPLVPDDVEGVDEGARNAIYAVCQVLARAGSAPDERQRKGLARLQATLDVGALEAEQLEDAAARHVLENASTQPLGVDGETSTTTGRHAEFREQRKDRVHARHTPRRHTSVHGPRGVGVFGSGPAPGIEKG